MLRIVPAVLCAVTVAFAAFTEVLLEYPLPTAFYLGLFGATSLSVYCLNHLRFAARFAALFLVGVLLAGLNFGSWSPRKPFLQTLRRVQPGMSEAEVRQVMAGYLEGTGWPAVPFGTQVAAAVTDLGLGTTHAAGPGVGGDLRLRDALVFRHSDAPRYNSDWGIVHLKAGRVVSVAFSPD